MKVTVSLPEITVPAVCVCPACLEKQYSDRIELFKNVNTWRTYRCSECHADFQGKAEIVTEHFNDDFSKLYVKIITKTLGDAGDTND